MTAKKKTTKRKTSKRKTAKRKTAKRETATTKKQSKKKTVAKKSSRPYPIRTLEEALVIPQAIREKNNGHPWATENVSQAALGIKKTNNKFYYTAAASRDYGLTTGTRYT